MPKVIDARGLSCPQPVFLTRKAMEESEELEVIVSDETAKSNITRIAEKSGWDVKAELKENDIYLNLKKKTKS